MPIDFAAPFNAALDRFDAVGNRGVSLQNALMENRRRDQEAAVVAQYKNALMQDMERKRLAEAEQAQKRQAFDATVGVLMNENIGPEDALSAFSPYGMEGYQAFQSMYPQAAPTDPLDGLPADIRAEYLASQNPQIAAALQRQRAFEMNKAERGATRVSQTVDTGKREEALVKPIAEKLPAMRENAELALGGLERINSIVNILNQQGDKVTGVSGSVRAAIAPYAATVGMNTQEMDDAQLLQAMLQEGAGTLRMAVVGPGPVSEYEQKILQAVSGKRISSAEGLRRLLMHQRERMTRDINTYRKQVKSVSNIPGYGSASDLYPDVQMPPEPTQQAAQPTTSASPPRQARPGMKWQRNTRTGEYREVPAQ